MLISAAALTVGLTQGFKSISESLIGYEEVPAVSTVASGEFRARISNDDTRIDYELSYADLEGAVTQAPIQLGQRGVNGGISVWLCGNPSPGPPPINPPVGTPACLHRRPSWGRSPRTRSSAPRGRASRPASSPS